MDLSDGSDVEEGMGDVDQDAENVLLGSDDEELNYSRAQSGHHGTYEENEDKVLETDEEEDVLELALDADEELDEFVEEPLKNNRVAPVKVRIQENVEKPMSSSVVSQSTIDTPQSTTEMDDEEEAEADPKNTRSRFLTERKTEEMNSTPVGNPIQILGERKGRVVHTDLRQTKSWGNQRPQGRQFNRGPRAPPNRQSLLGDAPRHQVFRPRFPNANEAPVLQFQERIFTDFNQPLPMGQQQQQQINSIGPPAPMHNPSNSNPPRPPTPGNRGNLSNQTGNRQRLYKTQNNPFENGPRPRIQNSGPRNRHPSPQQWKNRQPHPQAGSGMPPEVSGVHPAVIISGNAGPSFQGHQQNSGNAPNRGPPPHGLNHGPNHGPGPNNLNHGPPRGPPGPNMGPNAKRPPGPNMHGPPMGPNLRGPPQGPHKGPNVRGPLPGPNVHGPPHNPNMQGPPQGPNMHAPPQGPHPHGPPPQGQQMHGQPQGPHVQGQLQPPHHHGPGPGPRVHSGGPMQGPNVHGPPQPPGPNPNMHRMIRPNNQPMNHGPPQHVNQNFGPVPNNFNQGHPVRPGFEHHLPNNPIMQKPHVHGDHPNRPNDLGEMGFNQQHHQPRPMHPQLNVRAPFGPQQHQFPNPSTRMPGPPNEMVENGPYFHQPPGPNHTPGQGRMMDGSQPPFWNNPQGHTGNQDPNAWNHHQEHVRNIVVVQPNNIAGDFRNAGPPVEQYPGQHPGVVNPPPPPNHYGQQQYQNYDSPGYLDLNPVGPIYEQHQTDPYYQEPGYDQYGAEYVNPVNPHSSHLNDHANVYAGDESAITRTIVVSNAHEQEQFLSNTRREVHSDDYYHSDRLPRKRRTDDDYYDSPGKRLNHRLGPPVRSRERDEQREKAVRIILETKKEMGLDEDYTKKLEDQKRLREQILRKKEERRKLTKGGHDSEDGYDSGHGHGQGRSSRSTGDRSSGSEPVRYSVYINPKAYKGDLSLLNTNLKKINMNATSKAIEASNERKPERSSDVPKSRTILRIVRNKKGKIISQEKVKVMSSEHQDGPSKTKSSS